MLLAEQDSILRSLICGRQFAELGNEDVRCELASRYDSLGGEVLLEELRKVDRNRAEQLHYNDRKRIIRALEIYQTTGMTMSEHDELSRKIPPRYDACMIALSYSERADLYAHIDRRVDDMVMNGLTNEVEELLKLGVNTETYLNAGHWVQGDSRSDCR